MYICERDPWLVSADSLSRLHVRWVRNFSSSRCCRPSSDSGWVRDFAGTTHVTKLLPPGALANDTGVLAVWFSRTQVCELYLFAVVHVSACPHWCRQPSRTGIHAAQSRHPEAPGPCNPAARGPVDPRMCCGLLHICASAKVLVSEGEGDPRPMHPLSCVTTPVRCGGA